MLMMKQVQTNIHRQLNAVSRPIRSSMAGTRRYRDNEDDTIENQLELDQDNMAVAHPRWYRRGPQRVWGGCLRCWPSKRNSIGRERRRRICAWVLIAVVILTLLGVIAGLLAIL